MMGSNLITFISAVTALCASILAPLVTMRAARTQFNANVLSGNRQRWIETFRELVASLLSQLYAASLLRTQIVSVDHKAILAEPAMLARIEHMVLTMSKIRLMTNPNEEDHQRLLALIAEAVALIRGTAGGADIEQTIQAMMDDISRLCQSLLKREWVRVKRGR